MGLMDLFKKKSSGDVAKDRLKLLLVTDRASCSPEMMEQIKNEIIQVISKHMDIDMEGLDIQITQTESESNNGTVPALFVNIPLRSTASSKLYFMTYSIPEYCSFNHLLYFCYQLPHPFLSFII